MTKNDVAISNQYLDMEINQIITNVLLCNAIRTRRHVFNCIESHLANIFPAN